jgi:hypothetical protein
MTAADAAGDAAPRARVIAFYLPQFHPIPENDRWWGTGFTEWTNVSRARPLFRGHRQPRVPADLGFYDLRLPETRAAQAELAASHGIAGFCYWHYWFHGKRLLERPFEEVLKSGAPDLPFCLAWANEPWTRTWLGRGEVLQEQRYSADDDVDHGRWLLAALADERALRVDGRALFLVYRPDDLPEPRRTTDGIRAECVRAGLPEPFLVGINSWSRTTDCRPLGFDATRDYEPQLGDLPGAFKDGIDRVRLQRNLRLGVPSARLKLYRYADARRLMNRRRAGLDFPHFPTIMAGWDSSPRRGRNGIVLVDNYASEFERGLRELVDAASARPADEQLVFVTAWNEWAEGNYLEPDTFDGTARLEAVRRVVIGP